VGASVEDLLKDPKNSKWMDYSVEFCGGTHLRNSNEIKDFAITEEESVAKGVRRIVALTFYKAHEASLRATKLISELEDVWNTFEKKSDLTSNDIVDVISKYTQLVDKSEIPLESRESLRNLLKKIF